MFGLWEMKDQPAAVELVPRAWGPFGQILEPTVSALSSRLSLFYSSSPFRSSLCTMKKRNAGDWIRRDLNMENPGERIDDFPS